MDTMKKFIMDFNAKTPMDIGFKLIELGKWILQKKSPIDFVELDLK